MDRPVNITWLGFSILIGTLLLNPRPTAAQTSTPTLQMTATVVVTSDPALVRTVDNWITTGSVAPTSIQIKPGAKEKAVTVILASEIELGDRVYETKGRRNSPRNVILVADTIRITGPVTFDLSGYDLDASSTIGHTLKDRSGGDLILLARNFVCEPNGKLIFRSSGGRGHDAVTVHDHRTSTQRRTAAPKVTAIPRTAVVPKAVVRDHRTTPQENAPSPSTGGGLGGNLVIAAERFVYGSGLHEADAFRDLGCIEGLTQGGAGTVAGRSGTVRLFDNMKDAAAELQQDRRAYGIPAASHSANYAISKWVTTLLDDAVTGIRVAGLTTGRIEAARRLRQATSLADWEKYPVLPEDRPAFEEHLIDLDRLKDQYQTALWTSSRSLANPSGVPLQVDLFTDGRELRTRVAPTLSLVRSRVLGGRKVIGLLEFDPERPDIVRMEFEVELTVDPWLEGLLVAELASEGDEYAGIFSNWILTGREISELGIRESSVTASGETVRVSLTVDAARASLIMANLASSGGLPLTFDWQYRNDLNLTGVWRGPGLSLQRRTDPAVELDGAGMATNTSDVDLTIEYVRVGDDFHPLNLTLHPGETAAVLPTGADPTQATIPAAAVAYSGVDPFRFESDFHIINGEELVEQITVTNRLGLDPARGGALEYVEVNLTYIVDSDDTSYEVPAGPYRLSSRETTGSEITVSFLKPQRALRRILVSGTAYYENDSLQTLTTTTFSDLTIKITDAMLP